MQTINKGDGQGTGDSVKTALMKSADNFAEVSARLDDIEARGFPRKVRGWGGPVAGFPQVPSAKGSSWTAATRKGSATFAAINPQLGMLLPMPSGRLLALAGTVASLYAQIYTVNADGSLTAVGAAQQIQSVSTGQLQAVAMGPNLAVVTTSTATGGSPRRIVLDTSGSELAVVSDVALNASTSCRHSFNGRGLRSANSAFGVATEYSNSSGGWCGFAMRQSSALAAETMARDATLHRAAGTGYYAPTSHDLVGSDSAVVVTTSVRLDGTTESLALLVAVNDAGAQVISRKSLAVGTSSQCAVVALSASRVLARPSMALGIYALQIVDGELQLMTTDIQTSGILGRTWSCVCCQDDQRALVFEQLANTTVPTVIKVDPATGAVTERNTVPLVFGTSGTATPFDAIKIGADRIAVIGKSASSGASALVEVWDLT